jgi:hypothetical protein
VIDVVPKGDHGEQLVVFTAEDVDGKFCVSSYSFSEPLIIDPAIIDRARKEIGGKARWLSAKSVTYINPKTGAYESGYFEKYSKVAVKMVVLCDDPINKLSIIFDTADGKRAFIDVLDDSFLDTIFLPADPKKKYNWPHRAWAAIERGEVYVGMSETQVYFSWGAPDKVNETRTAGMVHHQLVYRRDSSTAYVYTQNERVTAIQE